MSKIIPILQILYTQFVNLSGFYNLFFKVGLSSFRMIFLNPEILYNLGFLLVKLALSLLF